MKLIIFAWCTWHYGNLSCLSNAHRLCMLSLLSALTGAQVLCTFFSTKIIRFVSFIYSLNYLVLMKHRWKMTWGSILAYTGSLFGCKCRLFNRCFHQDLPASDDVLIMGCQSVPLCFSLFVQLGNWLCHGILWDFEKLSHSRTKFQLTSIFGQSESFIFGQLLLIFFVRRYLGSLTGWVSWRSAHFCLCEWAGFVLTGR